MGFGIRGLAAWMAGVFLLTGCSGATSPQATKAPSAAPARDVAILYVPPPWAVRGEGIGESMEMRSTPGAAVVNDAVWERSIASHARLITHSSNLLRVLTNARSGVRATKWFTRHDSPEAAMAWLQQHFRATPVPGTALIELSIDGDVDRAEVPVIVNEIANAYLDADRDREMVRLVEQIDLLTTLKNRYEQLASRTRTESSNLAATLQLDGMGRPGVAGQKEQELQLLTAERLKAISAAAEAERAHTHAMQDVQAGRTPGIVEFQLDQNWEIVNLRQQVRFLKDQAGAANAPADRLAATERELAQRLADKRVSLTEAYLSQLKGQSEGARSNVDTMTRQIDGLKSDLAELGAKLADYTTKKEEETTSRELARRYTEQIDRLKVTQMRLVPGQVIFAARRRAAVTEGGWVTFQRKSSIRQ